ncbi:MAG: UTP--glucose-1-phosphate uridylyltransferase [Victivallaceae bacterium]|nr:UTP--glucose-1-phosphate uridylyltransferase [Victivallaceae bacterium]
MKINEALRETITAAGQEHLLRALDALPENEQADFAAQLENVDFNALPGLIADYVLKRPEVAIPDDLGPAPYYPLAPENDEQKQLYRDAVARGEEMIRAGRVACLTVAGGQGTRLGFDGPKGTFPIGPVTGRPLFAYFAGGIRRTQEKYGVKIVWYLMTSQLNHAQTVDFFKKNSYFGLDADQVFFFTQGTMPAIGYDGKLLMNSKKSLALSPDGHGGTLLALRKSGALDAMKRDGVDVISYFQVDNPLVPVIDPKFIGLHALTSSQMSAVMLAKTNAMEKLGNFCVSGGRLQIIEYSDLPKTLAEKTLPDGSLAFIPGSPAIHVIDRAFVEELTAGGKLQLPWHRADKKIPFLDAEGNLVSPETPNGVKLESFIFDALPLARRTMVLECDRAEVFAPTKNRTGVDSVDSCRAMLVDRDARRLAAAGVKIPRDAEGNCTALIEISPALAVDAGDVARLAAARGIVEIASGEKICLE